ncbi:MAG: nucleotidyltransferase family protein [Chloroflexota bacterium]|nr:nucleotidyltransferase family protein [Chloroflexota bacterium]
MVFVSTILLAAGESTRMGSQKALLPWESTTLLEYQLAQLAAVDEIGEIIVVTGHEPERIREVASLSPRTKIVHNHDYRAGKVGSILVGLRSAAYDTDAVMVIAVDQPRTAEVLRTIIETHASSGSPIAVPEYRGRRGHPPIFTRELLPELLLMTEDTQGLRAVLRIHADEVCEVDCDASVLVDLNRPGDVSSMSESKDLFDLPLGERKDR